MTCYIYNVTLGCRQNFAFWFVHLICTVICFICLTHAKGKIPSLFSSIVEVNKKCALTTVHLIRQCCCWAGLNLAAGWYSTTEGYLNMSFIHTLQLCKFYVSLMQNKSASWSSHSVHTLISVNVPIFTEWGGGGVFYNTVQNCILITN